MKHPRIAEVAVALAVGLVFGLGLIVSRWRSAKVLGFLDLFGSWDPSLMLVMASAVGVGLAGFAFDPARTRRVGVAHEVARSEIDRRLVIGALVFGAGWGLAGFCPGPALVAVGEGSREALLFAGAMVAGMLVFEITSRRAQ